MLLKINDVRLLRPILRVPVHSAQFGLKCANRGTIAAPKCARFSVWSSRYAKTKAVKSVKDLQQGIVQGEPLPDVNQDEVAQYPTVVQGARDNMIKFRNCVVLTRVGNFYELYFDQAEEYAPLLNLKVGYKKTNAGPVAMAGFPFFQIDRFLKMLVQDLNKYVAISEEFPINAAGKAKSGGLLFDRRVARVVTPGTLIDEKFLDPYQNNFLLALHLPEQPAYPPGSLSTADRDIGLAWLDLSTGDFLTQVTSPSLLPSALTRIGAREIIVDEAISAIRKEELQALAGQDCHLMTFHNCSTDFVSMSEWNHALESPLSRDADAQFSQSEKLAGHWLLDYVQTRLQGLEMKMRPPRRREMADILSIDRSSIRGLEILETARDGLGKGSLLHAVRRTVTKGGARLLRDRLTAPSASLAEISHRLDLVTAFLENAGLRDDLVLQLGRSYDVQRLVQKFVMNKGDADDMVCLARAIDATTAVQALLRSMSVSQHASPTEMVSADGMASDAIASILARIDLSGPDTLSQRISHAIDEDGLSHKHQLEEDEAASVAALAQEVVLGSADPSEIEALPKKVRTASRSSETKDVESEVEDVWIMRRDATETLKRLHDNLAEVRQEKIALTQSFREKLASSNLTLKWTPALGHIVHLRGGNGSLRTAVQDLQGRVVSSSKSTMSFYHSDWSRLGGRIDQAKLYIRNEEQRIFLDLRQHVITNLIHLRRNAAVMDELDVACAFARLAEEQSWTRPKLNTGFTHRIMGGRHPTVKLGLEESGRSFVSNDLVLGDRERIWLVTGPNMGGKSTFLRQNALISILAQVGCYVPADYAEIGLVDQVFSRIGAADDLFRDQSTFMVEMLETADILKHATPRSFVIMDEVGRGTTPEDGTAIGFACLHHLHHVNKCRTLFATHFHALADMTEGFEHLARYCTDVSEDRAGSFSFMHRLRAGVNRHSHALKVARLAGLPEPALNVAHDVLQQLLADKHNAHLHPTMDQQPSRMLAAAAG